jgi:hypothetical protein
VNDLIIEHNSLLNLSLQVKTGELAHTRIVFGSVTILLSKQSPLLLVLINSVGLFLRRKPRWSTYNHHTFKFGLRMEYTKTPKTMTRHVSGTTMPSLTVWVMVIHNTRQQVSSVIIINRSIRWKCRGKPHWFLQKKIFCFPRLSRQITTCLYNSVCSLKRWNLIVRSVHLKKLWKNRKITLRTKIRILVLYRDESGYIWFWSMSTLKNGGIFAICFPEKLSTNCFGYPTDCPYFK